MAEQLLAARNSLKRLSQGRLSKWANSGRKANTTKFEGEQTRAKDGSRSDVKEMARLLKGNDQGMMMDALLGLLELLRKKESDTEQDSLAIFCQRDLIMSLTKHCSERSSDIVQMSSLECLAILSRYEAVAKCLISECNGVGYFLAQLNTSFPSSSEVHLRLVFEILGNLAYLSSSSAEFARNGAVQVLVSYLAFESNPDLIHFATNVVRKIVEHASAKQRGKIVLVLKDPLSELLLSCGTHENVDALFLMDLCSLFSWCTESESFARAILQERAAIVPRELLSILVDDSCDKLTQLMALVSLGNLVAQDDTLAEVALGLCSESEETILDVAVRILEEGDSVRSMKECCWILSNVALGPSRYMDQLFDPSLLRVVFGLLEHSDAEVAGSASRVVLNLSRRCNSESQLESIIRTHELLLNVQRFVEREGKACQIRSGVSGVIVSQLVEKAATLFGSEESRRVASVLSSPSGSA